MAAEHVPGDREITSVALYSSQPILATGLEAVMAERGDCTLSGVLTALDPLIEHVRMHRPSVVLIDVTETVTLATLSELQPIVDVAPVVLWVDSVSTEFVSKALMIGVRGILRQSLPAALQMKCLCVVAMGDLWVEQALCGQLLTSRRIRLTRRERQLAILLAQGLKNKEIAYAMTLSEGTVKVYLTRLFKKTGVTCRFELALFALKNCVAGATCEPEPAYEGTARTWPSPAIPVPLSVSAAHPAADCA
jgi:DNA-binding NarL/FixJ family response regulator